jgi:ribonuclease HI
MTDDDIERILRLEASLNTVEVRAAPDAVLAILDEGFVEIDSKGRIWDGAGVAEALSLNPKPHDGEMESVRVLRISDDVQLLTYSSPSGDFTNRHTSVWVRKDGEWRVVFHQQTRVI